MIEFWRSKEHWAEAAASQRYYWDRHKGSDRELVELMRKEPQIALWKIARLYRVGRNFPRPNRAAFAEEFLRRADPVETIDEDGWFDRFIRITRSLAAFAKGQLPSAGGKTYRPLSGVSKFLWHRHPTRGFIYDANALKAVGGAGLLAPFYEDLRTGRWDPPIPEEEPFLLFAAAYRRYFLPLHAPLANALLAAGRDSRCASRIVDHLLWINGGRALDPEIRTTPADEGLADAAISAVRSTWPA